MSFKSRIHALMAGIMALVLVLILAGGWEARQMLQGTDRAYQQGLALVRAVEQARGAQVNFQRQVQEWKNVLIRGGDAGLRDSHWKGFQEREALMKKGLAQLTGSLGAMGNLEGIQAMARKSLADHEELGKRYRAALQKYPGAIDAAAQQTIDREVRGADRPTSEGIDTLVDKLEAAAAQRFADESAAMHANMRNNLLLAAGIALALMAALLGLTLAISRSVFNSLGTDPETAVAATARISGGDLTERLNARSPRSLIGALEMMQSRLRNISLAIREVAFDMESRTQQMPAGAMRDVLRGDVERLRAAVDRIQIERRSS